MTLKLSHQAAILIGVPLLAELIVFITLMHYLDRAQEHALQAKHAKDLQAAAMQVVAGPIEAMSSLFSYSLTKSTDMEKAFNTSLDSMPQRLTVLKHLTESNPEQLEDVKALEKLSQKAIVLCREFRQILKPDSYGFSILRGKEVHSELRDIFKEASKRAKHIYELDAESSHFDPDREDKAYQKLKEYVQNAVIASIFIVIILPFVFYQSTHKRLSHLTDNAKRLSEQKPLSPPLEGEDELASFDRVFHEMAQALQDARRKEIAIIDKAVDVICSISWDGSFTAVNPAVYELWAWEPEDLVGTHVLDLVVEGDRKSTSEQLKLARSNDVTVRFENSVVKKDGSVASMLWSVHSSEEEQSIFCVVHDITDRKEIERLKTQFMSMVSHDLRAPLTSIRLFLEVLREGIYGNLSPAGVTKTEMVDDNVNRLIVMVNDLLDLEQLEIGGITIYPQPCNFFKIVERTIEAVAGLCHQHKVSIVNNNSKDILLVVDEDRIVQVMVNFVSNAVKFSPFDGIVTIEGEEIEDDLLVKVIDRGPGIPKEHQKTIFERFKQSPDAPTAHKKMGTGLGLHIAMSMIELHQGEIGVDSEEGKGSSFWFRIPKNITSSVR